MGLVAIPRTAPTRVSPTPATFGRSMLLIKGKDVLKPKQNKTSQIPRPHDMFRLSVPRTRREGSTNPDPRDHP
jgi:hypothetical protein